MFNPSKGENDMTAQAKAIHKEARKLTNEMHRLEQSGSDSARLADVYARLVELETMLWGAL